MGRMLKEWNLMIDQETLRLKKFQRLQFVKQNFNDNTMQRSLQKYKPKKAKDAWLDEIDPLMSLKLNDMKTKHGNFSLGEVQNVKK